MDANLCYSCLQFEKCGRTKHYMRKLCDKVISQHIFDKLNALIVADYILVVGNTRM